MICVSILMFHVIRTFWFSETWSAFSFCVCFCSRNGDRNMAAMLSTRGCSKHEIYIYVATCQIYGNQWSVCKQISWTWGWSKSVIFFRERNMNWNTPIWMLTWLTCLGQAASSAFRFAAPRIASCLDTGPQATSQTQFGSGNHKKRNEKKNSSDRAGLWTG
jgi:hypothetical protein